MFDTMKSIGRDVLSGIWQNVPSWEKLPTIDGPLVDPEKLRQAEADAEAAAKVIAAATADTAQQVATKIVNRNKRAQLSLSFMQKIKARMLAAANKIKEKTNKDAVKFFNSVMTRITGRDLGADFKLLK